jgi:hypothetical protein
MAKKKAARTAKKGATSARKAVRKAAAARRPVKKTAKPARKAAAAKKAKKKAAPKARKAAPTRKAASRRKSAGARKAAAVKRKRAPARAAAKRAPSRAVAKRAPARTAAAAKPGARSAAKPTAKASAPRPAPAKPPGSRTAAKSAAPARKANLDRPRRTVADIHGVPSSLDMGRDASAVRSGRAELAQKLHEHTNTSPALTAGDVDADWGAAESAGDEAPGGDNPTPDQDVVEEIGRALGVEYDDDEELQGGEEIAERDRHRWELDPESSDDFEER